MSPHFVTTIYYCPNCGHHRFRTYYHPDGYHATACNSGYCGWQRILREARIVPQRLISHKYPSDAVVSVAVR